MYHDILKSDLQMASCMSEKMTVLLQEENNLFLYILFVFTDTADCSSDTCDDLSLSPLRVLLG